MNIPALKSDVSACRQLWTRNVASTTAEADEKAVRKTTGKDSGRWGWLQEQHRQASDTTQAVWGSTASLTGKVETTNVYAEKREELDAAKQALKEQMAGRDHATESFVQEKVASAVLYPRCSNSTMGDVWKKICASSKAPNAEKKIFLPCFIKK